MNTPYNKGKHLHLLQAAAPGLRMQPADGFGANPSNAHWAAIEVPVEQQAAFEEACKALNIYRSWDTAYPGYCCNKLCKYVRDTPEAVLTDGQIKQVHGHAGGLT
jgi:hypothetical protein